MALARSKLTSQGQVSVPASVRAKLGVGPGELLEWAELDDHIVVRRVGTHSWAGIRAAVAANPKRAPSLTELKAAVVEDIRRRHARR